MTAMEEYFEVVDGGWCTICHKNERVIKWHDGEHNETVCKTCLGRMLRFLRSGGRSGAKVEVTT